MNEAKRFPPQIKFIVGNEAAERYSFYGMSAILTLFMMSSLGFSEDKSKSVYHLFVSAAFFTPLLGAYISDRYWGKYRTIMTLSFVYVAGHAVLSIWNSELGLYVGLGLVALGAGGIKPCVSAHVGDQFTESNSELLAKVFNYFYFAINFGSLFATLATPYTRRMWGAHVAFAIPGVLMAVATFVFWLGRKHYIHVPPSGARADTPGRVLLQLMRKGADATREKFGDGKLVEARAVASVAVLLIPIIMFWALFFQTGSSWVLLTARMNLHGWLEPDALQAANPALVMAAIPLFVFVVYPQVEKRFGIELNALKKMGTGLFVTSLSFVAVAVINYLVDAGNSISALWMILPYVILTAGEVLVSVTGLEFIYTQAPRAAKSTLMGLWYVVISIGSGLVTVVTPLNPLKGGSAFLFWSVLTFATGFVFIFLAKRYTIRSYIETSD